MCMILCVSEGVFMRVGGCECAWTGREECVLMLDWLRDSDK